MLRTTLLVLLATTAASAQDKPIKVLLVTGGCCHNYGFQKDALIKASKDLKLNIEWKVFLRRRNRHGGSGGIV